LSLREYQDLPQAHPSEKLIIQKVDIFC